MTDKHTKKENIETLTKIIENLKLLKERKITIQLSVEELIDKLEQLFAIIDRDFTTETDELIRAFVAYMTNPDYNQQHRIDAAEVYGRIMKFYTEISQFRELISQLHLDLQEANSLIEEAKK